ncbi:MAG TPA: tRNA (adenosine(37)-N6)-threonylcarbamoyltransferase complex ATPase subunit type 1 TsaE [Geminicoccaceae bacterium]|nr:tRNA (adenosine(37)-N6)-threonylcarbamoyltransferase complex ATPase subunit type 1 TsaE [Geminicoccus sp.]HMU49614.1 tRNA (adenosine(37)-N6)-threonylcarbamoyltransferase complex ATPase subunit type 1 TsaE [Geminicoccaceae bacterium]
MSATAGPSSPSTTATELSLPDLAATRAFAARLAALLRPGDLVGLEGDLGAGKSELARAVIRALAGAEIEVPSPSFTLVQHYDLPHFPVVHADLYRLSDAGEVAELGLDETLQAGALLVEWPERTGDQLPADRLTIRLAVAEDSDTRTVVVEAGPGWRDRLADLV